MAIIQARYKEHVMEERTFISPTNKAARTTLYVARLDRASLERQMSTTAERAAACSSSEFRPSCGDCHIDNLSPGNMPGTIRLSLIDHLLT